MIHSLRSAHAWPVSPALTKRRALALPLAAVTVLCLALALGASPAWAAGGAIKGNVTVEGAAPTEAATVELFQEVSGAYRPDGEIKTTVGGEYDFSALVPGKYKLKATPGEAGAAYRYYPTAISLFSAAAVTVSGEAVSEANIALQVGATIQGHVVEEAQPLHEVSGTIVHLYAADAGHEVLATTTEGASYEFASLPAGGYLIEAEPPAQLRESLAPRFFGGGVSFATATEVKLTAPLQHASATEIQLAAAATFTGTVTDAATHQPLAGIVVKATNAAEPEAFAGSATTATNGEYRITGLPAAGYSLTFARYAEGGAPIDYVPLKQPPVTLANGETATVAVALIPDVPTASAPPTIAGTGAPGSTLSCATGTWLGAAPISYSYRWLRDGAAIAGATASTYDVQAADQGHSLMCEVTATNTFAAVAARSAGVGVPVATIAPLPGPGPRPPQLPPSAQLAFSTRSVIFAKRASHVRVACAAAACAGTVQLTEQVLITRLRGRKVISRKRKTLVLATATFTLAAGHSGIATLRLTKVGRSFLATYGTRRLPGRLVALVHGGATVTQRVVFGARKRTRKR